MEGEVRERVIALLERMGAMLAEDHADGHVGPWCPAEYETGPCKCDHGLGIELAAVLRELKGETVKIRADTPGRMGGRITHPQGGWVRLVVDGEVVQGPFELKAWKPGQYAVFLPECGLEAGQTAHVEFSETEEFEKPTSIFP